MIEVNDITLELKDEYKALCGENRISYYSFTNIFTARGCSSIKYVRPTGGGICVIAFPKGFVPQVMMPLGGTDLPGTFKEIYDTVGEYALNPISAEMAKRIERECPGMFAFAESRDNSEYIYEVENMISLSGNSYHSKRNFINRFNEEYDYEYKSITAGNIEMIVPVMEMWFHEHPGYASPFFNEHDVLKEIIGNFTELGLKGGAIVIDGEVRAFTIGERLAVDMAHIIIEKADVSYMGIYPAINKLFLENEWADCRYVNREEDMGIEGLRKAKLSYHPCGLSNIQKGKLIIG